MFESSTGECCSGTWILSHEQTCCNGTAYDLEDGMSVEYRDSQSEPKVGGDTHVSCKFNHLLIGIYFDHKNHLLSSPLSQCWDKLLK